MTHKLFAELMSHYKSLVSAEAGQPAAALRVTDSIPAIFCAMRFGSGCHVYLTCMFVNLPTTKILIW